MKVEIITIGDEVLSGAIVDTNTAWIGDRLWSVGLKLHWHTTVADEPDAISQVLRDASQRSEAVVVTGGLGPTIDDITIEVAAKTFGKKLELRTEALETIRKRFEKLGRTMTPNNEKQALLPQGTDIIPNASGTAPGCHAIFNDAHYFFLPGVPREMKQMFEETVLPKILTLRPEKTEFVFQMLRCFGLPEATIDNKLQGIDLTNVDLAFRVAFPEILLKISAWGSQKPTLETRVGWVSAEIRQRLGEVIYAEGDRTLPALVGELLMKRADTLAVAESCTGGYLANLITDVPGSSNYFQRGVVTYSNQSKEDLLGVSADILKKYGAVSVETAVAMAQGLRERAGTTYALATTGIAGPDGGTPEKPVGTVHIALAGPSGVLEKKLNFATSRDLFKRIVAFSALDWLRKTLLKSS